MRGHVGGIFAKKRHLPLFPLPRLLNAYGGMGKGARRLMRIKGLFKGLVYQSLLAIVFLSLPLVFDHGVAEADQKQISCPQDDFVIDESLSEARIPGTRMSIENVEFLCREKGEGPCLGAAGAIKSGKKTYYFRDSTEPGMPLPADLHEFFRLGDLVVIGACEGSGGCNGASLLLLRIKDDQIKLVDTWQNEYLGDLDYAFELQPGTQRAVDGGALFRIDLWRLKFSLFVKASHDGFSPVLDPSVYKPFCGSTGKLPITNSRRLRQSCVCRYLLQQDKEKARKECRSEIERYYGALIRKIATFPGRPMTYQQYHDYLSPRLDGDWEYTAIAEAYEGIDVELINRADIVRALKDVCGDNLEETMQVFANFSNISGAFRPEGVISLGVCNSKGGAK